MVGAAAKSNEKQGTGFVVSRCRVVLFLRDLHRESTKGRKGEATRLRTDWSLHFGFVFSRFRVVLLLFTFSNFRVLVVRSSEQRLQSAAVGFAVRRHRENFDEDELARQHVAGQALAQLRSQGARHGEVRAHRPFTQDDERR